MSIGVGVGLLLAGLVLALRIFTFDFTWVDEYRLGVLLTFVGIISIALSLVMHARSRRTHIIERQRPLD